jgi:(R,R)-butanediol dehydrogenase/meso-butanediol dehydrogenase/diacetyl reductase
MYAAVLSGEKNITVKQVEKPAISADEVLVKVELCGICGTDLHAYLHPGLYPVGTIFGHECAGIVDQVGSGVSHVKVGDRVAVHPAPGCGECINCLQGRDNVCDELNIGSSLERPGCFAEYVRIAHPERALYKIPETMSFADAALIEPLATAYHAVRQSHIQSGDSAVVLGSGPIGLAVVQYLKLTGVDNIIVVEISTVRGKLALQLGADLVLDPLKEGAGIVKRVAAETGGEGAAVVYECTGVPKVFSTAVDYLKTGGQLISIGVIEQETPINPLSFILKEAELRGSMCYSEEEFARVIEDVALGNIRTDSFLSGVVDLKDIEKKGVQRLLSSSDAIKILVKP